MRCFSFSCAFGSYYRVQSLYKKTLKLSGFFQPCGQKSFNFIEAFSCYKKMRGGVRGSV